MQYGCLKLVHFSKKLGRLSSTGSGIFMTTSAGRFVHLNYSDLARSFSEMKFGLWLKTKDTFMSSFEGQRNIAPTRQLFISVLCCYLLSESNYGNIFFSTE